MSVLALAHLLALACVLFLLIASCAVSLVARIVVAVTETWSAARRHRALVVLGVAPVVLTATMLAAVLAPSALAVVWPALDHCAHHADHHLHLCLLHRPMTSGGWQSWAMLAVAVAVVATYTARSLIGLVRAARHGRRLLDSGVYSPRLGATVVPTAAPLCVALGALRPEVLISRGLVARLSSAHLSVALAHERAHVLRRDVLARLVVRFSTCLLLPGARRRLLHAITIAAEQACDEHAARHHDRLVVADAIISVERLVTTLAGEVAPVASLFTASSVETRIVALLNTPSQRGRLFYSVGGVFLPAMLTLAAYQTVHHVTESVLGLLAR